MDTFSRLGAVQLSVGDPAIVRLPYGRGVAVDFGDITPVPFATFDAAVAEIKARKDVPPADDSFNLRGSRFAAVGGAGTDRPLAVEQAVTEDATPAAVSSKPAARLPQGFGGQAPEPAGHTPQVKTGSGAAQTLREGGAAVPAFVGAGTPISGQTT